MSFLLSVMAVAAMSSSIVWENDVIEIPLYEPVEMYKNLPYARLFVDGEEVIDPDVYYEVGVERTFFSVVHSNIVKSHVVKYRVTFPNHGDVSSVHAVTFNVVDVTAPVIVRTPDVSIPVGTKMPDMREGLVVTDDYDPVEDLLVIIDTSSVMTDVVGIHDVRYVVTDTSGNRTTVTVSVTVYDARPPTIEVKSQGVVEVGGTYRWSDHIKISDNVDQSPEVVVDDSHADWKTPGTYDVIVTATDDTGLTASITVQIIVIDVTAPTLDVVNPILLTVGKDLTEDVFLEHVIRVHDNVDDIGRDDVVVGHAVLIDVLGRYEAVFSVMDSSGNLTEKKIRVDVVDDVRPEIVPREDLVFDVGSVKPFWDQWFDVLDNHDAYEDIVLVVKTSVDMDKIGVYPLEITATDSSKNTRVLKTYVRIVDREAPLVTQTDDIVVTGFTPIAYRTYFIISDNYDPEDTLEIEIRDDTVDYTRTGEQTIEVVVSDSSGNRTVLETTIYLIDVTAPDLVLALETVSLEVFEPVPDMKDLIVTVNDDHDDLDVEDIIITGVPDVMTLGCHVVTFMVLDSAMNKAVETIRLCVDDTGLPEIKVPDHTRVTQGDVFDVFEGVEATDNSGQVRIDAYPASVDTQSAGMKTITYVAVDSRGNTTVVHRLVDIIPVQKKAPLSAYIPMFVITAIGVSVIVYLSKTASGEFD
jgi:hypothetical protein